MKVALEPFAVTAQGKANLQGVAVADGDRPLVTAARIEATGIDYAWPATAKIDRIEIQKPTAVLERRADGTVPLGALLVPPGAAARDDRGAGGRRRARARRSIDVAVREVVVTGGSAVIIDGVVSPPARAELGDLRLTAKDVTWPTRGPASIQLQAALPGGGSASAEGRLGPDARSLDLKVGLRDVDLALTRGYLARRGTVAGKAGGDFDVKVALEPLVITARGAASMSDVSISDDRAGVGEGAAGRGHGARLWVAGEGEPRSPPRAGCVGADRARTRRWPHAAIPARPPRRPRRRARAAARRRAPPRRDWRSRSRCARPSWRTRARRSSTVP